MQDMKQEKTTQSEQNKPTEKPLLGKIITITTVLGIVLGIAIAIKAKQLGLLDSDEAMAKFMNKLGPLSSISFVVYQLFQTVIPIIPGGVSVPAGTIAFGWFWGFILSYFPILTGSMINFWLAKKYGWKIIRALATEEVVSRGVVLTTLILNAGIVWLLFRTQLSVVVVSSITGLFFAFWWWQIQHHSSKKQAKDAYQEARIWFKKLNTRRCLGDWIPIRGKLASQTCNLETIIAITMVLPFFPADLLCYVFGLTEVKPRRLFGIFVWTKVINLLFYGIIVGELSKWLIRLI